MSRAGDPGAVVPGAEPRSYYDQPIIKAPVWTVEIPWYLFAGGLAGASSALAAVAHAAGDGPLSRAATRVAAGATLVSPPLLVSDLGRPARFVYMLRVAKPTSPMSVGSWVLAVYAPAAVGAAVLAETGRAPRLAALGRGVAAVLGPVLATYTAVLVADTAVPVWHEGRRELPFAFAGGAVQSAGAGAVLLLAPVDAGAARRVLVAGTALREVGTTALHRRAGVHRPALEDGVAGRYGRASRVLSLAGAALVGTAGRTRRSRAVLGAGMSLAGAVCERFAVFRAGFASAADPQAVAGPQRQRLEARLR